MPEDGRRLNGNLGSARQHRREIGVVKASLDLRELLGRTLGDDFAALDPALGAEVDDPVHGPACSA